MIYVVSAKVYSAEFNGRRKRFFTRKAAFNWLAWRMINSKPRHECHCESPEWPEYPGFDCGIHEYLPKIHARFVRYMLWLNDGTE